MTCSEAWPTSSGGAQGYVGLVTRERAFGWGIESTRYPSPNVVSCKVFTGLTHTSIVGTYLPEPMLEHLPDMEEVLQLFRYPIVLRGLNLDLNEARILRIRQVADLIAEYDFIDLVRHFRQRRRFQNLKIWSQVRQGTVLWS